MRFCEDHDRLTFMINCRARVWNCREKLTALWYTILRYLRKKILENSTRLGATRPMAAKSHESMRAERQKVQWKKLSSSSIEEKRNGRRNGKRRTKPLTSSRTYLSDSSSTLSLSSISVPRAAARLRTEKVFAVELRLALAWMRGIMKNYTLKKTVECKIYMKFYESLSLSCAIIA